MVCIVSIIAKDLHSLTYWVMEFLMRVQKGHFLCIVFLFRYIFTTNVPRAVATFTTS